MTRRSLRELDAAIAAKNRGQRPAATDEAAELAQLQAQARLRLADEAAWSTMTAAQRVQFARDGGDTGPAVWLERARAAEAQPPWEGAGEALQRAESDAAAARDWLSRRQGELGKRQDALTRREIDLEQQRAHISTANDLRVFRQLEAEVTAERSALEAEVTELDELGQLTPHVLRERWEQQLPAELERLDAEIARQGREQPPVSSPHHEPAGNDDAP